MMKSIIIASVTILPQLAFSQYYGEMQFGIAASKMSIPKQIAVDVHPVYNPLMQASIIKLLGPKFSWVLSGLFTSYGFEADETEKNPSTILRLNYIEIIPKIEYKISRKLGASAGITFGKLLSTKRKAGNDEWKKVDEFNFFEDFEFGITGGLQYNLGDFILGISYTNGLNNIAHEGDGWTDLNHVLIDNPLAHNRSLSLGLSYRFKL